MLQSLIIMFLSVHSRIAVSITVIYLYICTCSELTIHSNQVALTSAILKI